MRGARRAWTWVAAVTVTASLVPALTAEPGLAAIECQTSWTATGPGNWFDPDNWSAGVPDATTQACIGSGDSTVEAPGHAHAKSLAVGSGQTLLVHHGPAGGSLTVTSELLTYGTIVVDDADLDLSGATVTHRGFLRTAQDLSSNLAGITVDGWASFANQGGVQFDAPTSFGATAPGVSSVGMVTVGAGVTVSEVQDLTVEAAGTLQLLAGGTLAFGPASTGMLTLRGHLDNNGTLVGEPGAGLVLDGTTAAGSGVVDLSGGHLEVLQPFADPLVVHAHGGGLDVTGNLGAGTEIRVEERLDEPAARLRFLTASATTAATVTLLSADTGTQPDGVSLTADPAADTSTGGVAGHVVNTGTITFAAGDGAKPATVDARVENHGTVTFGTDTAVAGGWGLDNHGTVSVATGTTVTLPGASAVSNAGTLDLLGTWVQGNDDGTIANTFHQPDPGQVTGGGTLALHSTTLSGVGTIAAEVTVEDDGSALAPGGTPGRLDISGGLTIGDPAQPPASLEFEIAGREPGTGYDQIAVGGTATINAADAAVTRIGEIAGLTVCDRFDILTAAHITGAFTASMPADQNGIGFRPAYHPGGVAVIAVDAAAPLARSADSVEVTEGELVGASYALCLTDSPPGDVTVALDVPGGQATVSPASVTFTTSDWMLPRTVTVLAVDDTDAEPSPHLEAISHTVTGLDATLADVTVVVNDNGDAPADPPAGDSCDTRLTTTGAWTTASNWDNGVPDATTVACVTAGLSTILDTDADVLGLTVEDGATLTVASADLFAETGADNAGTVVLDRAHLGVGTDEGATLHNRATGLIRLDGPTTEDVPFAGLTSWAAAVNEGTVEIRGHVDRLGPAAGLAPLTNAGLLVVFGDSTVRLPADTVVTPAGTLALRTGASWDLPAGGTLTLQGSVRNDGTITAVDGATVRLDGLSYGGAGTVQVTDATIAKDQPNTDPITFVAHGTSEFDGTVETGQHLIVEQPAGHAPAHLALTRRPAVNLGTITGRSAEQNGRVTLDVPAVAGRGTLDNRGTITFASDPAVYVVATLSVPSTVNTGLVDVADDTFMRPGADVQNLDGGRIVVREGARFVLGSGDNGGTFVLNEGDITVDGTWTQFREQTGLETRKPQFVLRDPGTVTGGGQFTIKNGLLTGFGPIDPDVRIEGKEASLQPDDGWFGTIGAFAFGGDLSLVHVGNYSNDLATQVNLDLESPAPGGHDSITVAGHLGVWSRSRVEVNNSASLGPCDNVDLIEAGTTWATNYVDGVRSVSVRYDTGVSILEADGPTVDPDLVEVTEGGKTATYRLCGATENPGPMIVAPDDRNQVTVSPAWIEFTDRDYWKPRTITVTAVDDTVAEPRYQDVRVGHALQPGASATGFPSVLATVEDDEPLVGPRDVLEIELIPHDIDETRPDGSSWVWRHDRLEFTVRVTNHSYATVRGAAYDLSATTDLKAFCSSLDVPDGRDTVHCKLPDLAPGQQFADNHSVVNTRPRAYNTTPDPDAFDVHAYVHSGYVDGVPGNDFDEQIVGSVTGVVHGIEVNQGLQDLHNSVPLVAGRRTGVRVVANSTDVGRAPQLWGWRDGQPLPGSPLSPTEDRVDTADDVDRVRTANFVLPSTWTSSGAVRLGVSFHGGTRCRDAIASILQSGRCDVTVAFDQVAEPRVRWIAVKHGTEGWDAATKEGLVEMRKEMLAVREFLPVADINSTYHWMTVEPAKDGDPHWESEYQIADTILDALARQRKLDATCAAAPCPDPGRYVGFAASYMKEDLGGRARGAVTTMLNKNAGRGRIGAHELAHSNGRPHSVYAQAPEVKDEPTKVKGPCGAERNKSSTAWPYVDSDNKATIGPLNADAFDAVWGVRWGVSRANWVGGPATFEFMSYCRQKSTNTFHPGAWVGLDNYLALHDRFFRQEEIGATVAETSLPSGNYLLVDGAEDSGDAEVYATVTGSPPGPTEDPNAQLVGYDSTGTEVVRAPVLLEEGHDTDPGEAAAGRTFNTAVPAVDGLARLEVVADGTTVASVTASDNPPTVTVNEPASGTSIDEPTTLRWSAHDLDGDRVSATVRFSPDGPTWQTLGTSLTSGQLQLDPAVLPPTTDGTVEVTVTDGFHTTTASLDGLVVADAGPTVTITSPEDGGTFADGELRLEGIAADGNTVLPDDALVWSSDLDGELGTGPAVVVDVADLTRGRHVLTLHATDTSGDTAADQVIVWVGTHPAPDDTTPPTATRLAGTDRYETAAAVSRTADTASTVYVATGRDYPDALAASAAAGNQRTVVLLVHPDAIPEATRAELVRLAPDRIVIVGGTVAIGDDVEHQLAALAGEVVRRAGRDRFETAALISRTLFPDGAPTVYLATGHRYADALSASVPAAMDGGPVLFVTRDAIPDATRKELARLAPQRVVVVGGTAVIAPAVTDTLTAQGILVERRAGEHRYATAVAASRAAFPDGTDVVFLATGHNWPDGLTGAAAAARAGAPVLLLPPDGTVPVDVRGELARLRPTTLIALGGLEAIPEQQVAAAADAAR